MKTLTTYAFAVLLCVGLMAGPAQAQTNWQAATTISAAMTTAQNFAIVASATGIAVRTTALWFPATGEVDAVTSINGTTIGLRRGGTNGGGVGVFANASGATVIVVPVDALVTGNTSFYGSCTGAAAPKYFQMLNSEQNLLYVCMLSGTWQARQGTPLASNHTMVITR